MANVKNRVNTTKTASTKINPKGKVGRPKKSLINVPNVTGKDVKQKKERRKIKKPLDKDLPVSKNNKSSNSPSIESEKCINRNDSNHKCPATKSGRIKHKNKIKLDLFNEILKSELLGKDRNENSLPNKEVCKSNNNEIDLTNDNCVKDSDNSQTKPVTLSKKPKRKKYTQEFPPGAKFYQCDYCNKKFSTKQSLRRHLLVHDNTSYSCPQCKKYFSNQLYLAAHTKRQHPNWEKHFMCNICDKPFLLKSNLKLHLASHSRNEKMFKCIYCKEKYVDQHELIEHEKQHLVDGKYLCIICEMGFDCRNRLNSHYRKHLKVKDFICQHCGKEFLRMNSVRRHVQICHTGHRIQCKICKKYLKGHLSEHMRTHEKNRPHECPECGQRFTQSTQLTVHRRSHSGARPYTCRICQRPFTHSNALMLHIRRHTGEKPFKCAMCPLSFSQLPHMKAHMRNIHGKEKPYRCERCKQFFKLKADLEDHSKACKTTKKNKISSEGEEMEEEPASRLSRMRFLLALLLTMIATKEKLKFLGFNKRLIDDLLIESLEAMGHKPCKDDSLSTFNRLESNIEKLLEGTVPKEKMEKLKRENKTTEEILELLTDDKKKY